MKIANQLTFTTYEASLKLKPNDPTKIIFDNIDWSFITIESTHLRAYSSKLGKKTCSCKGKCHCPRDYSDPDARWKNLLKPKQGNHKHHFLNSLFKNSSTVSNRILGYFSFFA